MDEASRKVLVAEIFGRAAPTYDQTGPRYFSHFGRRLVALANVPPGASVLDVAHGRGAVLLPAAEAVGPNGQVTGIDLAEPMVVEMQRTIERQGLRNVTVRLADAEMLPFDDDSFDVVLCGFAIFFFPNQAKAMQEFHRVLRPGGRIGVSVWGENGDLLKSHLERLKTYGVEARGLTASPVRTPEALHDVLLSAGFRNIQTTTEADDFEFASAEEWWADSWSHGVRYAMEQLTPSQLEQLKRDVFADVDAMRRAGGIRAIWQAHFGLAEKLSA